MKAFIIRTFSSITLTVLFSWIFFSSQDLAWWIFAIISGIVSILLVMEFHLFFEKMLRFFLFQQRVAYTATLLIVMGVVFGVFCEIHFTKIILPIFLFLLLIFSIQLIFIKKDIDSISNLIFVYLPIFLFVIPLLHITPLYYNDRGNGMKTAIFLIFVTKSGDIGAYIFGTLTAKLMRNGNHKMIPTVSPKKSWEGFLAGLICSLIVAWFCRDFIGGFNGFGIFLLTIVLYLGGVIGDLMESSFKRAVGIKDSGSIIPGIGGFLDLADSLVLNAPILYYILYFKGVIK